MYVSKMSFLIATNKSDSERMQVNPKKCQENLKYGLCLRKGRIFSKVRGKFVSDIRSYLYILCAQT